MVGHEVRWPRHLDTLVPWCLLPFGLLALGVLPQLSTVRPAWSFPIIKNSTADAGHHSPRNILFAQGLRVSDWIFVYSMARSRPTSRWTLFLSLLVLIGCIVVPGGEFPSQLHTYMEWLHF